MFRIFFSIPLAACLLQAQNMPPTKPGHHRPAPPLFTALDANQDGVIDATEIANASAALKKLDKNGDGKLSPDEYRPPRPDGSVPRANEPRLEGRPRPDGPGSPDMERRPDAPPKSEGPDRPPRPLIDSALDVNGDEIISADEIAKASSLLKKLDANGDGKLSREECFPKPPMRREGHSSKEG